MERNDDAYATLEVSKQTGTWLQILNGELVNLDGIKDARIVPYDAAGKFSVSLFPVQFGEIRRAFIGSEKACTEYMQTLGEFLGAKQIVIYEKHPCACECGCQQDIIEDFTICDECDAGGHVKPIPEKLETPAGPNSDEKTVKRMTKAIKFAILNGGI